MPTDATFTPVTGNIVQWATNPKTVAQAIAYAQAEVDSGRRIWYRRCLAFVGTCYGIPFTGTPFAVDIWSQVPASIRHASSTGIPAGALLVYRTSSRAGHIALYAGGGMVYSNDINGNGIISRVHFNELTQGKWRLNYLGWVPPFFPKNPASKLTGTTELGSSMPGSTIPGAGPGVGVPDPAAVVGAVDTFNKFAEALTKRETWIRILLVLIGAILIYLALYRMTGLSLLSTAVKVVADTGVKAAKAASTTGTVKP